MSSVEIIGAGVAGFTLARELVRRNYAGQITLHDPEGLPYDRPPLSKSLERIPLAAPQWYDQHKIRLTGQQVRNVVVPDTAQDWVVLATGTTPRTLDCPGAEHARVIHTAADAEALSAKLSFGAFGTSVVVIGAGLIGAEFASAAREFGAMVTLISQQPVPGGALFGEPVAEQLHEQHRHGGIRVITGEVERLTEDTVRVQGEDIAADIIVSAIGVRPNTLLAAELGLEVADGILVDQHQRTSQAQLLAIGDAARPRGQRAFRHWDRAIEDAAVAAATIMGTEPPVRNTPWFWTDRHESHIEVVGDFTAASHTVERRNWQDQIQVSFGLDGENRLVAAALIDGGTLSDTVRALISDEITPPLDALSDPRHALRNLGENQ